MHRQKILLVLFAALAAACTARDAQPAASSSQENPPSPAATTPAPSPVILMTFNVENLFDTNDDAGKEDRTFLPLSLKQTAEHRRACNKIEQTGWRDQCLNWDWNEQILKKKMSVLAQTILQAGDGRGPDVLAMQEVENVGVLERLRTEYLSTGGYRPAILIEGQDERGIDVAFLTRLDVVGQPTLHPLRLPGTSPDRVADTRGILEATFRLPGGALLTGYAVHFPAPYHPTEMRVAAYEQLNALRAALPADRAAFAAGDFNTTSSEDREKSMLQRFARPQWIVVHEQGDVGGKGTNYYERGDSWSFLDMILFSPARGTHDGDGRNWVVRDRSARIANKLAAQVHDATPARFRMPEGSGVSDHWPLLVAIELK